MVVRFFVSMITTFVFLGLVFLVYPNHSHISLRHHARAMLLGDLANKNVIVGSSRTQALPRYHDLYVFDETIYASLPLSSYPEMHTLLELISRKSSGLSNHILFGVDFGWFGSARKATDRAADSLYIDNDLWFLMKNLYHPKRLLFDPIDGSKARTGEHARFSEFVKVTQVFLDDRELYKDYKLDYETLNKFESLLNKLRSNPNLEIDVFLNPMHAFQIIGFETINPIEKYFLWKKEMLRIAKGVVGSRLNFFDCVGINAMTTEPIASDSKPGMKWYKESSHYSSAGALKLLDDMHNIKSGRRGEVCTSIADLHDIDIYLAEERERYENYRETFTRPLFSLGGRR